MDSGPLAHVNRHTIREVQAVAPTDFEHRLAPGVYGPSPQDSALHEYLRVLLKRKWTVIACAAGIFALVAIATLRMTPVYDATGSVAVNKPDQGLLNFKDSPTVNVDYYDPTDLDTEVRVLQSDKLALLVIRQLNLDQRPEFGGSPAAKSSGLSGDPLQSDSAQTSEVLGNFKGNLHVAAIPNSRIIEIHYRSPDRQLASNVVNTLASVYAEQNFKTKFESTMQTADWLSKQLVDLQMKVESSQEKLVRYQKAHEILGLDEKQNITTQKLDELNKELTAAESDRMAKESLSRLAQSGDPEALTSAPTAGTAPGTTSSYGAASSLLDSLRSRQADLKIQIAELSTQFGPSYPKVAQLNNQLKEVETEIQAESRKVGTKLHSQYLAALARENMLRQALNRQKQEANKLNESAIEYSLLKRDLETNRTLYEGLLERLKEAGITAGLRSSNVKIVNAARVPISPSEPNIPRNLGFGLLLGLTSGIGLAFLLDNLDNTVRTPEQAQMISSLPALGMVPNGSRNSLKSSYPKRLLVAAQPGASQSHEAVELVTQTRPQSQMAESYRAIRTSLLLSSLGGPPKVILVTSALPQEGKTTTSINVAIVLAQKGVRVLLVDADLRRPSVHKNLGMTNHSGLSNVLTANATLEQAIVRSPVHPNLFILPAGTPPPNPAELLASGEMAELIEDLRGLYEHIVIDTPPTLSVTDAVVLSTRADSVVLVIRSGQTTKAALRRARDLLAQVNAKVTGVLVNAVNLHSPDYYYYEYQGKYGSHYYQPDAPAAPQDAPPGSA